MPELRCAYCENLRPDDDEACPGCGKPRFRHKQTPEEFRERIAMIEEHDRDAR